MAKYKICGEWKNNFCGGYKSSENPQILFKSLGETSVDLNLKRTDNNKTNGMILFLNKVTRRTRCDNLSLNSVGASRYLLSNNVNIKNKSLEPNCFYIATCCLAKTTDIGSFELEIINNDNKITNPELLPDYNRLTINSKWTQNLNGGYKSCINPQFNFTVENPIESATITLKTKTKTSLYMMLAKGFYKTKTLKSIENDDIYASSRYLISTQVSITKPLKPSDLWFLIITKDGKQPLKDFEISIKWFGEKYDIKNLNEVSKIQSNNSSKDDYCESILSQFERHENNSLFFKEDPVPSIIKYCEKYDKVFLDKDFLPNEKSNGPKLKGKVHSWKRSSEICNNPRLYVDGIDIQDMRQGSIGDCWLCQGIASIAQVSSRVEKMISPKKYNNYGVFSVILYDNKMKKLGYVLVDDYFPTKSSGELVYGHSNSRDELFIPLIEKAFAKIRGSYSELIAKTLTLALSTLTGGTTETFSLKSKQNIDKKKIWDIILEYSKNNWLMGLVTSSNVNKNLIKNNGLVSYHAYTLMNGVEVIDRFGQKVKLCKIRNTWGKTEWLGTWSDKDTKNWTPEIKNKLNFVDSNDGIFYMSFEDVIKQMSSITVCKIIESENYPFEYRINNNFGVGRGASNSLNNPKIPILVKKKTKLIINFCLLNGGKNRSIRFFLCKGKIKSNYSSDKSVIYQSKYVNSTSTKLECELEPDDCQYCLIPAMYEALNEKFLFIINSSEDIQVGGNYLGGYPHKIKKINQPWLPLGKYIYTDNPHVKFTIEKPGEVKMSLKRTDQLSSSGLIIFLTTPNHMKRKFLTESNIIKKSGYIIRKHMDLTHDFKKPGTYVALFCNQKQIKGMTYDFKIESEVPIKFEN